MCLELACSSSIQNQREGRQVTTRLSWNASQNPVSAGVLHLREKIGVGGMGEVGEWTDTRIGNTVLIQTEAETEEQSCTDCSHRGQYRKWTVLTWAEDDGNGHGLSWLEFPFNAVC